MTDECPPKIAPTLKRKFFAECINLWNSLPWDVVMATSLKGVKRGLDRFIEIYRWLHLSKVGYVELPRLAPAKGKDYECLHVLPMNFPGRNPRVPCARPVLTCYFCAPQAGDWLAHEHAPPHARPSASARLRGMGKVGERHSKTEGGRLLGIPKGGQAGNGGEPGTQLLDPSPIPG